MSRTKSFVVKPGSVAGETQSRSASSSGRRLLQRAAIAGTTTTPAAPKKAAATVRVNLTGEPAATPADGIRWIHNLCRDLQIPPLSSYGLALADVTAVVEKAAQASSMKANAIALTTAELEQILRSAITGSPA